MLSVFYKQTQVSAGDIKTEIVCMCVCMYVCILSTFYKQTQVSADDIKTEGILNLSPSAQQQIKKLSSDKGGNLVLRVGVRAGGCRYICVYACIYIYIYIYICKNADTCI